MLPLYRYAEDGGRVENITDWALKQFQETDIRKAGIGSRKWGAFQVPNHEARHLPLRLRRAAPSGLPREIRDQSQARVPENPVL